VQNLVSREVRDLCSMVQMKKLCPGETENDRQCVGGTCTEMGTGEKAAGAGESSIEGKRT